MNCRPLACGLVVSEYLIDCARGYLISRAFGV